MMKRFLGVLFALVLAFSLVVLPGGVAQAAPHLYEYYNIGDSAFIESCPLQSWKAQTFTAESNHSVTSVKLKLSRIGSPGTITVSIRATDGSGHPTGTDKTSGTTDGNTLTTSTAGGWREIALTSYNLTTGTKYAIVVRAPGGPANCFRWRVDSAGTYAGGNGTESIDSGTTWGTGTALDFMFEVHGPPLSGVGGELYPVNKVAILIPWLGLAVVLILAIGSGTLVLRRRQIQ